jgi:hypothetical protein
MATRQHGDKWATHFSDHVNEVTKDFHVMFLYCWNNQRYQELHAMQHQSEENQR